MTRMKHEDIPSLLVLGETMRSTNFRGGAAPDKKDRHGGRQAVPNAYYEFTVNTIPDIANLPSVGDPCRPRTYCADSVIP